MKKPVIILLHAENHPISEVIDALIESEPMWHYDCCQGIVSEILLDESRQILVFTTAITSEAKTVQEFCENHSIPVFGINIIPIINGEAIRRAEGDNPFATRYLNFNASTTAHMVLINSMSYFNPNTSPCAV